MRELPSGSAITHITVDTAVTVNLEIVRMVWQKEVVVRINKGIRRWGINDKGIRLRTAPRKPCARVP